MIEELPGHIRQELIRLCSTSKQRTSEFSRQRPTRWSPTTVIDPRDENGRCFTDITAWDYIAECLAAGEEVHVIILDKPPGKKGYVLKIPQPNKEILYIKLQLCPPGVHGRSFHYSNMNKS